MKKRIYKLLEQFIYALLLGHAKAYSTIIFTLA